MDLQHLCTNCLRGTLQDGICTYCHKSAKESADRPVNALPARFMIGGRYYLGRVIGNGGFGITYLAWDCRMSRRVIVKELYPRMDVSREAGSSMLCPVPGQESYFEKCKQRFREEARALSSFREEPSIVDVYELVEANNTVYFSMEYLTGYDMKAYIAKQGRIHWNQMSIYVRKILYTLRLLHEKGLIHRDISPDNIFLTSVDEAKLIDFGSVRFYNNGKSLTTILKQVFAPVEQYYSNGVQGPWTDIYALSVTTYYALSGMRPPKAPDRVKKDTLMPLKNLCPQLPEHAAQAVTRGMSVYAKDRFQNVEQMAAAMFPGENIFNSMNRKQAGRKQADRRNADGGRLHQQPFFLMQCTSGLNIGRVFQIDPGRKLSFGRNRQKCEVSYPDNSPGISRIQCCVWCTGTQPAELFIRDENSSWGTFVCGWRIEPGNWYRLKSGDTVSFASENYLVRYEETGL